MLARTSVWCFMGVAFLFLDWFWWFFCDCLIGVTVGGIGWVETAARP